MSSWKISTPVCIHICYICVGSQHLPVRRNSSVLFLFSICTTTHFAGPLRCSVYGSLALRIFTFLRSTCPYTMHLCCDLTEDPNKRIWKAKVPLKIKIFLWLSQQNAILTKDNLSKRNRRGDMGCCFCPAQETLLHLFFDCPIARYIWSLVAHVVGAVCRPNSFEQFWFWTNTYLSNHKHFHSVGLAAICWAIWRARNLSCFEQKRIKSPIEIVCMASYFICY